MAAPEVEPEAQFAVYLVDAGPKPAGVVRLLQEITERPLDECAEMMQRSPALISLFHTEEAARDLVARCREFDAMAIIRPAAEPVEEYEPEPFTPAPVQRLLQRLLTVLGLVQIGVGIHWFTRGWHLMALGGVVFGIIVTAYYSAQIRRGA